MSTPNPLIPQGSLQRGRTSSVSIAVATVLAIHVLFFGGLLLQGCKKDATATTDSVDTNAATGALTLPAMDSNSLFYRNSNSLPADSGAMTAGLGASAHPTNILPESTLQSSTLPQDSWKLSSPLGTVEPGHAAPTSGKEYTVVSGDSFSKIAKKQNSTVTAIQHANPNVDPAKIRPGMKIIVPTVEKTSTSPEASVNGSGGAATYTVKPGDTLTKIAKNHGVTVGQLRTANNLRTSRVNVNQKLKIPASTNAPKAVVTPVSTNPTF